MDYSTLPVVDLPTTETSSTPLVSVEFYLDAIKCCCYVSMN
jgi:hypothetical protein